MANGAVETAYRVIRNVELGVGPATAQHDVTVCAADTRTVLLGNSFLAKIYARISVHDAKLTVLSNDLRQVELALDYSGATNLHEVYMSDMADPEIPSESFSSEGTQEVYAIEQAENAIDTQPWLQIDIGREGDL